MGLDTLIMYIVKSLSMRFFIRSRWKFEQIVWFVKWQKIHRTIEIRIKRNDLAFAVELSDCGCYIFFFA